MKFTKHHSVLVKAQDYDAACSYTLDFFDKTQLVNYDAIAISEADSWSGTDLEFWPALEKALAANYDFLQEMITELKDTGINSVDDLIDLKQGYQSKVFHIIGHLVDGFIGIDSTFYSLPEDSHQLSDQLRANIKATPDSYWLLSLDASFDSVDSAALVHM